MMKLFIALVVMLMAVSNVAAQEAPASAPGPAAVNAAGGFAPAAVASFVAVLFGLLF